MEKQDVINYLQKKHDEKHEQSEREMSLHYAALAASNRSAEYKLEKYQKRHRIAADKAADAADLLAELIEAFEMSAL